MKSPRLFALTTALLLAACHSSDDGGGSTATTTDTSGGASTTTANLIVEVDAASSSGGIRDLFGVNRKPTFSSRNASLGSDSGTDWNIARLYAAFGISQIRLHDSGFDICDTYTAAIKLNAGTSPATPVSGCSLSGTTSAPHFKWTPASVADADLDNPANYDFTRMDEALASAAATGAKVYLRLGESYNGPNDTDDPVAWAKVATNVYKHALGLFKPTAGIALDPAFVEVHNEPDGAFWRGSASTFHTLLRETVQRVRAAAESAGKNVRIGGAGFTTSILTSSTRAGNPANGFIAAVGAGNLDFYSAHHYGSCDSATLAESATFLRNLRAHVDSQGGSGKPLHITEWNIGLGERCGNALYREPRLQSFTSGVLTLMQDPAQNIEAAHFYSAAPIMALFEGATGTSSATVNPGAWAFLQHARLKGGDRLETKVCSPADSCSAGYAAENKGLLALAARVGSSRQIVVTNDGASAQTFLLRVRGLTTNRATLTLHTPPSGSREVSANGNPRQIDQSALDALLAQVTQERRSSLTVSAGVLESTVTIPAQTALRVELNEGG